jgi:hypothetical protein
MRDPLPTDPRVEKANAKVRSKWGWRKRLRNFFWPCQHQNYRAFATDFPPIVVGRECRDCGLFSDISFHETN